eukprot:433072_1
MHDGFSQQQIFGKVTMRLLLFLALGSLASAALTEKGVKLLLHHPGRQKWCRLLGGTQYGDQGRVDKVPGQDLSCSSQAGRATTWSTSRRTRERSQHQVARAPDRKNDASITAGRLQDERYRLHHNVLETGLRSISFTSSRISLADIAAKLQ